MPGYLHLLRSVRLVATVTSFRHVTVLTLAGLLSSTSEIASKPLPSSATGASGRL